MIRFNIKDLRVQHNNMTQKQLLDITGIRRDTLSKLENNAAKTISIEQINKLCEVFNCSPSDLITYRKEEHSVEETE